MFAEAAVDNSHADSLTLEAQILRLADSVAYLNHDIADAIRAGMLKVADLPEEIIPCLTSQVYAPGFTHSAQSLRIVELLAHDGEGLNLTWEVRQGIISHRAILHLL